MEESYICFILKPKQHSLLCYNYFIFQTYLFAETFHDFSFFADYTSNLLQWKEKSIVNDKLKILQVKKILNQISLQVVTIKVMYKESINRKDSSKRRTKNEFVYLEIWHQKYFFFSQIHQNDTTIQAIRWKVNLNCSREEAERNGNSRWRNWKISSSSRFFSVDCRWFLHTKSSFFSPFSRRWLNVVILCHNLYNISSSLSFLRSSYSTSHQRSFEMDVRVPAAPRGHYDFTFFNKATKTSVD